MNPVAENVHDDVTEFARQLRAGLDIAGSRVVGDRGSGYVNLRYVTDAGMDELQKLWGELLVEHGQRMITRMVDEYRQLTADGRRRAELHERAHQWIDRADGELLDLLDEQLLAEPVHVKLRASDSSEATLDESEAQLADVRLEEALEAVLVRYGCPAEPVMRNGQRADRGDLASDLANAARQAT